MLTDPLVLIAIGILSITTAIVIILCAAAPLDDDGRWGR